MIAKMTVKGGTEYINTLGLDSPKCKIDQED